MDHLYDRLRLLGKGSFGACYLVRRKTDGAQFVAKEVKLAGMKRDEKQAALNEFALLRTLNHPNITRYVDHVETRDVLFIIMEYANGGDLYTKIKSRRGVRFAEKDVLHYFLQICLALMHIHEHHVLHRDLKTQNIFLTQDGVVKVGDFGISAVLKNTYECRKTVCGTPYYFSPELCLNKPYNNKSDVWALGCILYELATLDHAFTAMNLNALIKKILKGTYPPIHSSYSRDLSNLIASMLQVDPTRRPNIHEICSMKYTRDAMQLLHVNLQGANQDHKSCVDENEKKKARQEAAERVARENQLREQKEKALREIERGDKARRLEELKAQMEREQKAHDDRLAKIQEQKRQEEERRKELAAKARARAEDERKNKVIRDAQAKQREMEWEKNMMRLQKEREEQQEKERQQREAQMNAFRDARKEAEANKMRVLAMREAAPAPQPPLHVTPPRDLPPVEDEQKRKGRKEPVDMERARMEAYWEMRREAEANKRRLMGLDPLPAATPMQDAQLRTPPPGPSLSPPVPSPKPAVARVPSPVNNPSPLPPRGPQKSPPPRKPTTPEESDDDDDGGMGMRRFLNNDAFVQPEEPRMHESRELEYQEVQNVISAALNCPAQAVEDFGDPDPDPTKFMLEGHTLYLPSCSDAHPLGHRVESLRVFLEHVLGLEIFMQCYRLLNRYQDSPEEEALCATQLDALLRPDQRKYIPVMVSLMVCEDQLNHQA